jgi:transposase InsO family protein
VRLREALAGVWWPRIGREALSYVRHCNECGMNKPRRIGFAPSLKPLPVPLRPFYSLTMDFITDLPPEDGYDMILVVVDRFSKRVAFEVGRKDQSAEEWAKCLWDNVICKRGYGLPNTLTTDRDARFTAALWKAVFKLAGTRLIYTTAYHPSADGQSERVNQELEITLRFYVDALQGGWKEFLPTVEFYFNSSYSSVITQTPFQVLYGFTPSTQLTLLTPEVPEQLLQEREAARDVATEGLQVAIDMMMDRTFQDRSFDSD